MISFNVVSLIICFGTIFFCSQILDNVTRMGLRVTSCGDDMLQFRRCLAASFFLNAALKQPDGVYRCSSALTEFPITVDVCLRFIRISLILEDSDFFDNTYNFLKNISFGSDSLKLLPSLKIISTLFLPQQCLLHLCLS